MNHCVIINVILKEAYPRHAGAYRIASFVRSLGWDAEVLDYTNIWSLEELKEFANSRITMNTKFFGFSQVYSSWTSIMEKWCEWMRSKWPDIIFIAGAPAPPVYESKYLDYYVSGYGEEALVVLLKYLFSNGVMPKFDSTLSITKKIINADKQYPAYPCPTLLITYQDRDFIQPDEWLAIETSRGCIFKCDFCSYPILGVKEDYTRTSMDFERQVKEAYNRWGITKFNVVDSTFNDRIDKISKYADVVQKLSFDTLFGGYVRADLLVIRPRDREELLRMNFIQHYYGIETFNNASAKSIHKGYDTEKMKEGIKGVRDFFVKHTGENYIGCIGQIIGLQHETMESMESSVKWLEDNWSDQAHSFLPLLLWKKEFSNNTSAMTLDFSKYEYTELSNTEAIKRANETNIKLSYDSDPSMAFFPEEGISGIAQILWKNKHMDIFDAYEFWNNVHDRLWWRDNHFSNGRKVLLDMKEDNIPFLEYYKQQKLGI